MEQHERFLTSDLRKFVLKKFLAPNSFKILIKTFLTSNDQNISYIKSP